MPDNQKDPALEVLEKVKADADAKAKAGADEKAKAANDKKDPPATKAADGGSVDPAVRDQIKRVRGWTDSQLDAELRTAPLQEKLARYEIKEKYGDFDKYKDDFSKEMEKYAVFDRTPQLMEQVLWMVKGKNMSENPPKDDDNDDVVRREIHSPYPSSASGSSSGASGKVSKLNNEEKQMAYFLGVSEERYEASKKGDDGRPSPRFIRRGPEFKAPANGNSADHALGVLLKVRR